MNRLWNPILKARRRTRRDVDTWNGKDTLMHTRPLEQQGFPDEGKEVHHPSHLRSTRRLSRDRLHVGSLEAGRGYIMASQDLLDLLRNLLDRTAVRHGSIEVGKKSAPGPRQAYRQVLHRRA
jgi:hypothetical protein